MLLFRLFRVGEADHCRYERTLKVVIMSLSNRAEDTDVCRREGLEADCLTVVPTVVPLVN